MTAFLVHPLTPFLIALVTSFLGLTLWRSGREHQSRKARWTLQPAGIVIGLLGIAMLVGAGFARMEMSKALGKAPPGRLVDAGETQLHILCEGPEDGPRILWFAGGYSQGVWLRPNHESLKADFRSCIYDPAGTGFSAGPKQERSMQNVANEAIEALLAAGETPPFILAGHSWGGAIAANAAALHPDKVAGLVLLDATAPVWQHFYAAEGCPDADGNLLTLAGTMFGLAQIDALNPLKSPQIAPIRAAIGDAQFEALARRELRTDARLAARDALGAPCSNLAGAINAPGQLGNLPVLVIRQNLPPEEALTWANPGYDEFERRNFVAFNGYAARQNELLSSNTRSLLAPEGAGHYFPLTELEFTDLEIRTFLSEIAAARRGKNFPEDAGGNDDRP